MKVIDVFNGDADGIFSLIQLRKAFPIDGEQILITGVKRDINLLSQINDKMLEDRVCEQATEINALDISFDKNVDDIKRLLALGASIFYCDHHKAEQQFKHEKLNTLIDTSAMVCTGLLVSNYIGGGHSLWAIAALFGDGLDNIALSIAESKGLSEKEVDTLRTLGVLVNYNGYGSKVEDLHYHPAALYRSLSEYDSPLEVAVDKNSPYHKLSNFFENDLASAVDSKPLQSNKNVIAIKLPDEAWSRRISGTFGNRLAKENPSKAIVIASDNPDQTLTISLRAPKNKPFGASEICSRHPSGGGRASAAGVNALMRSQLEEFVAEVSSYYAN